MTGIQVISLAVVLLPLIAAIIVGFTGKRIGRTAAHTIAILAVGIAFIFSLFIVKHLYEDEKNILNFALYSWGKIGAIHFQIGFLIDRLSAWMMGVVTFISLMVHIYTVGYMRGDPGYQRFFCYIALFTFGMLMLIMSNNFLQLFFGWEMVGLMSYLLIGFWFQKESAIFANLKAFIVNRVGDVGFIVGISAIFYGFGTLEYQEIFQQVEKIADRGISITFSSTLSVPLLTFICLSLFVGAMGKSAQIPLHIWLPDSMEGPTPISALIHAATMVTAGVFMLARLSPLFEYSDVSLNVIMIIGALTCLLMGLIGIVQNDIKRIIAYSTLSQLGYMMTAMGASAYPVGIFHLTTHAFFKALLFLGAGSVIMALHHEQDIWRMGNLKRYMPITYFTMLLGSLALIGFPLFSGFYSKDLIIEAVRLSKLKGSSFAYPIVIGSVYITAIYTFRLFFVVFHTRERIGEENQKDLKESPAIIWIPLILLAIPSVLAGILLVQPLFQDFFANSLVIHATHTGFGMLQEEFKGSFSMGFLGFLSLPFWLGIAGILTAWLCYIQYPAVAAMIQRKCHLFYQILQEKYGFDNFNQWILAGGARLIGRICWQVGDQWLIDGAGVNGIARTVNRLSNTIRKIQTGYLYHYVFVMIGSLLFLLIWFIFIQ